MYIPAGWRDKEHSLSLCLSLSLSLKKNFHGLYIEPALNHEMVRAVLTERQTTFGNPRQIPYTTSRLGRVIVIDMRLRLTFVIRSVVGLPHREI